VHEHGRRLRRSELLLDRRRTLLGQQRRGDSERDHDQRERPPVRGGERVGHQLGDPCARRGRDRGGGAEPDPWEALVSFLERSLAMQAADRGLKELLLAHGEALDGVTRVRARLMPLVEQVLRRAQETGALRPDVSVGDLPMLSLMLGHVVDFAGRIEPELWRRYLALLLDGLRAEGAPLPGAALSPERLDAAMAAWRPRRR
jgi:hypothetical protein